MNFHDLYDGDLVAWQTYLERHSSMREWIHVSMRGSRITILPIGVETGNIGPISNVPVLVFILACHDGTAELKAIPINGFDTASAQPVEEPPELDYAQLLNPDLIASVIRRLRADGVVRSDDDV